MRRINQYISVLIILFYATSCKKEWLDEKTNIKLSVPTTLKDFQAMLDNHSVINMSDPALGEIASDGHYLTETVFSSRSNIEKNAYTWSKAFPYINLSDWYASYQKILYCNIVLKGLEDLSPEDEKELEILQDIRGQALFIRSFAFFQLSQIWAPVYNYGSTSTELGIPLRVESDINKPNGRANLKDTYDRIIGDLKVASQFLKITPLYKTRASLPATFALLARVYLSMGDFENAEKYAASCLELYDTLLDYKTLLATSPFPIARMNTEVIFHHTMLNYTSVGRNLRVESGFRNLYSNNDRRRSVYFGSSAGLITFKGSYNGDNVPFSGLAVNEVLLIRAECLARHDKVTEAIKDLNTLLQHRYDTSFTPLTTTDPTEALILILMERKKELFVKGLRWYDLRRLNRDSSTAGTLVRVISGQTYTLEPNSYKYTFPIPDDIIQLSGLQQNPGWD